MLAHKHAMTLSPKPKLLGDRELTVLGIPGHEDASIALFDERTGWLLTGDTVYPGRLYVRDWDAFRASIHRLARFARTHDVTWIVGTHVEIQVRQVGTRQFETARVVGVVDVELTQ